jgi:hypothetical protein
MAIKCPKCSGLNHIRSRHGEQIEVWSIRGREEIEFVPSSVIVSYHCKECNYDWTREE